MGNNDIAEGNITGELLPPVWSRERGVMRVGVCISGSGTNLEKLIEHAAANPAKANYAVACVFSDNPHSRAVEIARKYGLGGGVKVHPYDEFFRKEPANYDFNEALTRYDATLAGFLAENGCNLVVLAGYDRKVSSVIHADERWVTINVHPADLRVRYEKGAKEGKPKYTGLGWVPVAKALLDGEQRLHGGPKLCSTVHVVTESIDEGPIIMTSEPMAGGITRKEYLHLNYLQQRIDFIRRRENKGEALTVDELKLISIAKANQDKLKKAGDWVVLPAAVEAIANGRVRYARDEGLVFIDGKLERQGIVYRGEQGGCAQGA